MAQFEAETLSTAEATEAVDKFIELIRFPTISGSAPLDGSYDRCAEWLVTEMKAIGLETMIVKESIPHKPLVVGAWYGTDRSLPCLLLNSHYDVVPVVADKWTYPPFEGHVENDRIYGRGTQDMKCVCIQYIIALKKLKQLGFQPTRTIYLSYVPDEEIGGQDGMNVLMQSDWFSEISVALALDEGLASEDNKCVLSATLALLAIAQAIPLLGYCQQ